MQEVREMPRWEVCELQEWRGEQVTSWRAVACTPGGESLIHAESARWGPRDFEKRLLEQRAIIAALGHDGWEPMPVVTITGFTGNISSTVIWYFKRQRSD
jgi:hypothetical protein